MRIWDILTGQIAFSYQANEPASTLTVVKSLLFSADEQNVTSVTADGRIQTWNLPSQRIIAVEETSGSFSIARFSPSGGRLALGGTPTESVETQARITSVVQTLGNGAINIIVPVPSLDKLQSIADHCNAPLALEQDLMAVVSLDQLQPFISAVQSLPAEQLSPGCAADLIAVAEALQAQQ